jgi:hypothetical protein
MRDFIPISCPHGGEDCQIVLLVWAVIGKVVVEAVAAMVR